MADQRRAGDWTHREQRRASANEIITDGTEKKWYEDNFWIIFFLFMFWPVGLFLMWRSTWKLPIKVIVTVAVGVVVYLSFTMYLSISTYL